MSKLVIRMSRPINCFLIEADQLLCAFDFDESNVSHILEKVGDYKVDELCVYVKPDTRKGLEGIEIDHIITSYIDYIFKISQSDFDVLKAIAIRFEAKYLLFYSAYRHYLTIVSEGVIVDSYIDHNYIVASIKEGDYQSLRVCSADRLQRTVELCQMSNITYAQQGAIPELKNIEKISPQYYETLSFLQYVLYGEPCCSQDIQTGNLSNYNNCTSQKDCSINISNENDYKDIIEETASKGSVNNDVFKEAKKKNTLCIPIAVNLKVVLLYVIAGMFAALGIYGLTNLSSDNLALETRINEQEALFERLSLEENFLQDSISDTSNSSFYDRLVKLNEVLHTGSIVSIRFDLNSIEMTIFVVDDTMKDKVVEELASYYEVASCVFEKNVTYPNTTTIYKQYNIIIINKIVN